MDCPRGGETSLKQKKEEWSGYRKVLMAESEKKNYTNQCLSMVKLLLLFNKNYFWGYVSLNHGLDKSFDTEAGG